LGNIINSYRESGCVSMRVQKKHMYTHTHTSRRDAAESHRHQEYKSQPFACIISEISQALLLRKTELFKTNMEKQNRTLKMRKKNKILPVSEQIRFCFICNCSQRKFITLISPTQSCNFPTHRVTKLS